jgi:poly-D-alanine transfer protein DltD
MNLLAYASTLPELDVLEETEKLEREVKYKQDRILANKERFIREEIEKCKKRQENQKNRKNLNTRLQTMFEVVDRYMKQKQKGLYVELIEELLVSQPHPHTLKDLVFVCYRCWKQDQFQIHDDRYYKCAYCRQSIPIGDYMLLSHLLCGHLKRLE